MGEFRKVIEGKLGYPLYDCVWERAVKDHDGGDEQELAEVAEDLQQFAGQIIGEFEGRPTTKPRKSVDRVYAGKSTLNESMSNYWQVLVEESFQIDSDSRAALEALSAYAAFKANEDLRVTEFRARALKSGFLSTSQATELLHSYAARFLTLEQMQDLGIPLAEHKASLLESYSEIDQEEYFDHTVSLRVDPPGISLKLRYTNLVDEPEDVGEVVRCEIHGDEAVPPYKTSLPPVEIPGTGSWDNKGDQGGQRIAGPILVSGFDTADRPANVWPGSLVDEVYDLAQELSESFMWPTHKTRGRMGAWRDPDSAALFVLTGIAPLVHPIKVRVAGAGRNLDIPSHVSFEVLPWLPPETVFETYKAIRTALGVKLRNQGGRKFDVVTFVLKRSGSYDPGTWDFSQLSKSWDRVFPDAKFKDTSEFKTYFERGLKAVKERYYLYR